MMMNEKPVDARDYKNCVGLVAVAARGEDKHHYAQR